jgi:hypothetical protein
MVTLDARNQHYRKDKKGTMKVKPLNRVIATYRYSVGRPTTRSPRYGPRIDGRKKEYSIKRKLDAEDMRLLSLPEDTKELV